MTPEMTVLLTINNLYLIIANASFYILLAIGRLKFACLVNILRHSKGAAYWAITLPIDRRLKYLRHAARNISLPAVYGMHITQMLPYLGGALLSWLSTNHSEVLTERFWSHADVAESKFYTHFVVVILVLNSHWVVCSSVIEVLPEGERVLADFREHSLLTTRAKCLVATTWASKIRERVEHPGLTGTKSRWKFAC